MRKITENSGLSVPVPASLDILLKGLPSRETCDMLCKEYFVRVHAIVPIIHGPSFEKQYSMLWLSLTNLSNESMRSGIMAKNPSFLALLFAVLFAASTTCSAENLKPHFDTGSNRSISLTFLSLTKASLTLVSFPQSPSLDSLSAYLVSQSMLMREEEAITTCSFVGIALRIAQGMGLHRDGSHFNLDPIQAEVRRRIWWYIIHTDVMTSIGCGLPSIWVDDGCHDTRMISERLDGSEAQPSIAFTDEECQVSFPKPTFGFRGVLPA
jgi:Fungal specific transcription factor domain